MKKLYDEIMALEKSYTGTEGDYYDGYDDGFTYAQYLAAELAKKYDDEIQRLREALSYWSDGVDS